MEASNYIALSGQLALDQRITALAQNVANSKTAGYRAEILDFNKLVSRSGSAETDFVSPGKSHVSPEAGGVTQTKNQLDIAVKGDGFFAFQGQSGTYYSRDGRLLMANDGHLVNTSGEAVLDVSGSAIQLKPNMPEVDIAADGSVLQGGQKQGQIGLYNIDLSQGFRRTGNAGFVPKVEPEPVVNFTENGVLQGYTEESNVNPATAMTSLIQITRAFEAISNLSERANEAEKNAIEILGSKN